jgi:hypothetical protein
MADGLRIELSEAALVASPGGAVTTRCTVYNASLIVDEYQLRVSGIDPSWVEIPSATARIFPEAFETVSIQFRPPRSASVAAGDYPFTITGTSADNPALTASVSGVLTVGPFVDFSFDLDSPRQTSGEVEGAYTFTITNLGNAQLTIGFDATEETGQLVFAFPDSPLVLGAGETKPAKVVARPKAMRLGAAAVYQITIGAGIADVSPPAPIPPELERKTTLVTFQHVPGVHEPPTLDPQTVELAGQQTSTTVVLTNRSAMPITMGLSGSDKTGSLTFEFVGGNKVEVPAGQVSRIPVRITCLDRAKLPPPPAPSPFTIVVTPIEPAGEARSVQGELTQPSPADFRLQLVPEIVESTGPERVQLTIENVSPRAASFAASAASKDAALIIALGAETVDIPAHDRVTVPVDLTPHTNGATPSAGAKSSGYTIRVFPTDAPARVNEISGQYVFTPAALTLRLQRKEIETPGDGVFDLELENPGKSDVSVVLEASDRAGACQYAFDLPRLRIPARGTAAIRLTVTPPAEHPPDARWQFEVLAKPISPVGPTVRDEGVLIYRAPTVGLSLSPPERRGRRPRKFNVMVTNPTPSPMTVKLTATDRSGGLGVLLSKDTVELPPSGLGAQRVPLKVTPWKRQRGSGATALAFNVAATPVSPPGDAVVSEGRYVALPPRSRWLWVLLAAVLLIAFLFSPLYEHSFYAAGWQRSRTYQGQTYSGEHHFPSDVKCVYHRVINGDGGNIRNKCFAQGPEPPDTNGSSIPKLSKP